MPKQDIATEVAEKIKNFVLSVDYPFLDTIANIIREALAKRDVERDERFNAVCAFVKKMMQDTAWEGADLEGADAQDFGMDFGVLYMRTVTQEDVDKEEVSDVLEVGDDCYWLQDYIIKAARKHEESKEKT